MRTLQGDASLLLMVTEMIVMLSELHSSPVTFIGSLLDREASHEDGEEKIPHPLC